MKTAFLLMMAMFLVQQKPPKNDPNGTWEAETGTRFELRLADTDLHVQLVEGSNPTFLKYEVNLKNTGEVNTYKGAGYFVAKLKNGKECKFDTDWQVVVVQKDTIFGFTSTVVPDPDTCAVTERSSSMITLKKK
jgi:hypothetical protein